MHGDLQFCLLCRSTTSDSFANRTLFDSKFDCTLGFSKLIWIFFRVYVCVFESRGNHLWKSLVLEILHRNPSIHFLMSNEFLQKEVILCNFFPSFSYKKMTLVSFFLIPSCFLVGLPLVFVWNDHHHCKSCQALDNAKPCGVYINIIWERALIEPVTCAEKNRLRWKALEKSTHTHTPKLNGSCSLNKCK